MAQQKQIQLGTNRWPHSAGQRYSVDVSCGVGLRGGSDLALLWLWWRPVAVALIRTPSLGTSICHGCVLNKTKKKKLKLKRKYK